MFLGYNQNKGDFSVDKETVLKVVLNFRKAIEANGIKVDKLILFGSYCSGNQKEGSDIDLVVISDDFNGKGYWERIDILSSAIYEVFAPIEAIAMTPKEWENKESMIVDYAKHGEVVS